ncbi:hypothetical protein DFH27DRAFT_589974 [Peziza echinospora]|nr:hypothetical protein DFH27DRAFT_589974 [Peziza echinospora]
MPPKKTKKPTTSSSAAADVPPIPTGDINPYTILGVPKTSTAAEIRSAYLKLALLHHPDKAAAHLRESAHATFQRIAFSYGILSDEAKRARYDSTGRTSMSGGAGGDDADEWVDWAKFYREQYSEPITVERIREFKAKYQGSEEERADVLSAYARCGGDLERMFQFVMCSEESEAADVARFVGIVEAAIEGGEVERCKAWGGKGTLRKVKGRREGREAMEYAKKLGVYEVLFGKEGGKVGDADPKPKAAPAPKPKAKSDEKIPDLSALENLIRSRQKDRYANMISNIEDRYVNRQAPTPPQGSSSRKQSSSSSSSKKKRNADEFEVEDEDMQDAPPPMPTEEEFQATRSKLEKKSTAGAGGAKKKGRK